MGKAKDGRRVQPSKPGTCRCLKCRNPFKSPDKLRIRICPKCKRDKERLGLIGEKSCNANGMDIPDADEDF